MERRANNLTPKHAKILFRQLLLWVGLCFFLSPAALAQKKELDSGTKYTIRSIKVTGAQNFNENTVIAFTGLKVGDKVFIPGEKLSSITKKLWSQNLFSDIAFYVTDIEDDQVDLELYIVELPKLNKVIIDGVRKGQRTEIINDNELKEGTKITKNLITTTKNHIVNKYADFGFLNTNVMITTIPVKDSTGATIAQDMRILIDRGKRVKVKDINIEGNKELSDAKLRRFMKNVKQKNIFRVWKKSKYTEVLFDEDKASLIQKYKENGYRDARIIDDSLRVLNDQEIALDLTVEEGKKYYFGDIRFIGNSVYTDEFLKQYMAIGRGDTYNGTLLQERIADDGDPDAADLTNLYQNEGYLFSQINPVEVAVRGDTIDFEIRIKENKLTYFDHVTVVGNDKTNDHVIYRELRTRPGQKYSKRNVIRTIRELGQLGYFDAEQLTPEFKNLDPNNGTLDLEYSVIEKGSSQIELQGGYGGGGFVGTLGLSFNNFSLRNIFNKEAWHPLPMGDGQRFSLRAQASTFYSTYSLSIMEPWLGGERPIQFSTSFSHTVQYLFNFQTRERDTDRRFLITGGSVGIAKRLKWPDDYFQLSQSLSFQHFDLRNYNTGLFTFGDGYSNNLAYTIGIGRNSTSANPIYPRYGSDFSLNAKLSLPYSAFNGVDYQGLDQERNDLQEVLANDPSDGVALDAQ